MALRSGYKGFKKLINGLKVLRPGVLGIDIGTGLAIGQDGKLNVTGVDVTVAGNPEEAATAGDLTKLQIGDDIFNVPDTTYSNATTSAAGLMSATDKEKLNGLNKNDYFLRSEQDILGAKNFLPAAKTASANGLTFTVNNDGSVTISGTATADTGFNIGDYFEFKDGSYILSAGEVRTPYIYLNKRKGTGTPVSAGVNTGSGEVEFTVNTSEYDQYRATIWVTNGSDYTIPVTLYPMIRLASDPDDTYASYAMTNKELTDKVAFKVLATAAANQTYAQQLTALKTTYDSLSAEDKLRVKLTRGADHSVGCYPIVFSNIGCFGGTMIDISNNILTLAFKLDNSKAILVSIGSGGVVTYTDQSDTTNSQSLNLVMGL